MRHVDRGGSYFRIADPDWADPLDGSYAARSGGRWNPPDSFPVVYLNRDVRVARANVARKFQGRAYGAELLDPVEAPLLVETTVPEDSSLDAVTDRGGTSAGLPRQYPRDENGREVGWDRCQPIGLAAWEAGERGIACRTAAGAPSDGEELAWFAQPETPPLRVAARVPFDEWFW